MKIGAYEKIYSTGFASCLRAGDTIYNISYPADTGKVELKGRFVANKFPHVPMAFMSKSEWWYAMPMDMTVVEGSSGGGVFDFKHKALIGVVIGIFRDGDFSIAIPGSRILNFLEHIPEMSPEEYHKIHPARVAKKFIF